MEHKTRRAECYELTASVCITFIASFYHTMKVNGERGRRYLLLCSAEEKHTGLEENKGE